MNTPNSAGELRDEEGSKEEGECTEGWKEKKGSKKEMV